MCDCPKKRHSRTHRDRPSRWMGSLRLGSTEARLRPDLFLRCQWGVALLTPEGRSDGDRAKSAMTGIHPTGPHYELVKRIESKDQKVVEIYRRTHVFGTSLESVHMTVDVLP